MSSIKTPLKNIAAEDRRKNRQSHMAAANKKAAKRDVAPSKLAYRIERLRLTPFFMRMLRYGVPLAVLAVAIGFVFTSPARRDFLWNEAHLAWEKLLNRPEFMINLVSVEGASSELADAARSQLDLQLPVSLLEVDLETLRQKVQELDAVARADLVVQSGGVLSLRIVERVPVVVWRSQDGLELLDYTGHRVASLVARTDSPFLPLIAGEGAEHAVPEALDILSSAAPFSSRIRGVVRVGERRWDIVLDRGQKVLLPAENPVEAVEGLVALNQLYNLLERDVTIVDFREPQRAVVRLAHRGTAQDTDNAGINDTSS